MSDNKFCKYRDDEFILEGGVFCWWDESIVEDRDCCICKNFTYQYNCCHCGTPARPNRLCGRCHEIA